MYRGILIRSFVRFSRCFSRFVLFSCSRSVSLARLFVQCLSMFVTNAILAFSPILSQCLSHSDSHKSIVYVKIHAHRGNTGRHSNGRHIEYTYRRVYSVQSYARRILHQEDPPNMFNERTTNTYTYAHARNTGTQVSVAAC